jgi:Thiol:disulfide interchange protein DsbD, N-terminal
VVDGFHINSSVPRSSYLIPTKLTLNPPAGIDVGKIAYPAGTDVALPFAPDEKLNVYSGEFSIAAYLSAVSGATPGQHKVQGELSYQACNDRACYPPKKLPVSVEVTVVKSETASGAPRSPRSVRR